jgi:4-hydroxy-2-oxoglutarate aldolase
MFNGILPPLPTPFKEDGALDLEALRSNVESSMRRTAGARPRYKQRGGDDARRSSQVFATRKSWRRERSSLWNGALSTVATLDMTKRAADAGCDAALIVTPFYYKNNMTGEALKKHYFTIADQSPIPVMIYNVPANTGLNVASAIVAEIAQHPNVVGIKDSAGDINQIAETVRLTRSTPQGASQGKTLEAGIRAERGNSGTIHPSTALRCARPLPDTGELRLQRQLRSDAAVILVWGGGGHSGCEQHRAE